MNFNCLRLVYEKIMIQISLENVSIHVVHNRLMHLLFPNIYLELIREIRALDTAKR
jgi:hypothetical protein